MQIVLATKNLNKLREYRSMLKSMTSLDLLSLSQFPDYNAEDETGADFEEIAKNKALHAAKSLNRIVLADDSGLSVPALKGAPGIFSRRYAGLTASDAENRRKLLEEMRALEHEQRSAFMTCALALASPEGIIKVVSATCEGYIALEESGRNGFGYDPLFTKLDYNKTFAELDERTKDRISHRRKALDKLLLTLESL